MNKVFEELANFLIEQSDTYVYEGQFDEETLRSLVKGFAKEFESRIH